MQFFFLSSKSKQDFHPKSSWYHPKITYENMVQKDMNKFHVPWIYYHSHDYLAIVVRTPLLEIFANQKMSKHRVENSFAGILTYQILTINDEVCIPSLSSILLAVTILNLLLKGWSRFPCFFLGLSSILLAVTILSFLQKGSSRCLCFFWKRLPIILLIGPSENWS